MNVTKNKIDCMNKVHRYVNAIVPALLADIEKNGLRINESGTLHKSTSDRLKAIVKSRPIFRSHFTFDINGLKLKVDANYPTGECGCAYYGVNTYVLDNIHNDYAPMQFEERPILTLKGVESLINRAAKLEAKIEELKNQHYALRVKAYYEFIPNLILDKRD